MTKAAVAQTDLHDSSAGEALGRQIFAQLDGEAPDTVIVFASPKNDYAALLSALSAECSPRTLVGCSSAGEFTSAADGVGMACAVALRAPEMRFAVSIGRGLREDRERAAAELVAGFRGVGAHEYRHRTALVLTDALAGYADDLVERLTLLTAGAYRFVGGGAGDDAHFQRTHVFWGTEAVTDAVVALEILSNKPIGIGVRHGWQPASPPLRVTEAEGLRLASLNAAPAAEVYADHAEATQQPFDAADPMPFFLHNVLGVRTDAGYRLRVPLGVDGAGGIACAAEVPAGATAHIMGTGVEPAAAAAALAARDAVSQLGGAKPAVALFFDCVATRLRLGQEFGLELASLTKELGTASYAGFNTYGQIARAEGQFSGFHNCTAVVCVIPE
ncbi:MAG: FIST C-terminal domain-containing protein [Gemmatimonadota bacterium]|nr:FIST C-terminal domain-containing protein [Gemmatimonadota bacterium]